MSEHRTRRRVLSVLLILLAGAIVNVAVAWGCAFCDTGEPELMTPDLAVDDDGAVRAYTWGCSAFGSAECSVSDPMEDYATSAPYFEQLREVVPRWICAFERRHRHGGIYGARGWPRLSLCMRHCSECLGHLKGIQWGVRTPFSDAGGGQYVLPTRPLWPGFAANVSFYAALLWLVFWGPFALRRQIRRKRGRCIRCAYDLRGEPDAGCPECGWNRGERA